MMTDKSRLTKKQSAMRVHKANQGYGSRDLPLGRASPLGTVGKGCRGSAGRLRAGNEVLPGTTDLAGQEK